MAPVPNGILPGVHAHCRALARPGGACEACINMIFRLLHDRGRSAIDGRRLARWPVVELRECSRGCPADCRGVSALRSRARGRGRDHARLRAAVHRELFRLCRNGGGGDAPQPQVRPRRAVAAARRGQAQAAGHPSRLGRQVPDGAGHRGAGSASDRGCRCRRCPITRPRAARNRPDHPGGLRSHRRRRHPPLVRLDRPLQADPPHPGASHGRGRGLGGSGPDPR